jgi:hypothetical protein
MTPCEKCGKPRSNGTKHRLCRNCYNQQLREKAAQKVFICANCQKETKHYAFGVCSGCYQKLYLKSYHAEFEKNRRLEQGDHIRQLDKARNQTVKRKDWKQTYQQEYYRNNREKLLEYQSNYRKNDPERNNNYKRRRRARVNNLPDSLTVEQWHEILEKHNYSCAYCGATDVALEREHKMPACKGGGYTADNIVPACPRCNRRKQTMTDEEFRDYVAKYPMS